MNIIKGGVTAAKGFKAAGCEAQISKFLYLPFFSMASASVPFKVIMSS